MNLGGTSVPDATADNAPIPIFVNRCLSKTFVLTFEFFAIFFAFNAKWLGVAILPGLFSISRAKHTLVPIAKPFSQGFFSTPTKVSDFRSNFLSSVFSSLN